jgi:hypothetical protein
MRRIPLGRPNPLMCPNPTYGAESHLAESLMWPNPTYGAESHLFCGSQLGRSPRLTTGTKARHIRMRPHACGRALAAAADASPRGMGTTPGGIRPRPAHGKATAGTCGDADALRRVLDVAARVRSGYYEDSHGYYEYSHGYYEYSRRVLDVAALLRRASVTAALQLTDRYIDTCAAAVGV